MDEEAEIPFYFTSSRGRRSYISFNKTAESTDINFEKARKLLFKDVHIYYIVKMS